MTAVTKRKILKVCRDAGFTVLDIVQSKHFHVTAEKDGKVVTANLSVSPKSSFWPTWLIADIKRAMRESA